MQAVSCQFLGKYRHVRGAVALLGWGGGRHGAQACPLEILRRRFFIVYLRTHLKNRLLGQISKVEGPPPRPENASDGPEKGILATFQFVNCHISEFRKNQRRSAVGPLGWWRAVTDGVTEPPLFMTHVVGTIRNGAEQPNTHELAELT